jgi:hypothetical protein
LSYFADISVSREIIPLKIRFYGYYLELREGEDAVLIPVEEHEHLLVLGNLTVTIES